MCELSTLGKHDNKTNVPLHQIYLPKLLEIILKYDK